MNKIGTLLFFLQIEIISDAWL